MVGLDCCSLNSGFRRPRANILHLDGACDEDKDMQLWMVAIHSRGDEQRHCQQLTFHLTMKSEFLALCGHAC